MAFTQRDKGVFFDFFWHNVIPYCYFFSYRNKLNGINITLATSTSMTKYKA